MRLVRPWQVEGRCEIGGATDKQVLNRLAQQLAAQRKLGTWHADNMIGFTDHSLIGPNWYALAIFTSGRVWIERDREKTWLRYTLHCPLVFFFPLFFAAVTALVSGFAGEIAIGLKHAVFLFAVLYGLNMLIALPRASSFFRNVARDADR